MNGACRLTATGANRRASGFKTHTKISAVSACSAVKGFSCRTERSRVVVVSNSGPVGGRESRAGHDFEEGYKGYNWWRYEEASSASCHRTKDNAVAGNDQCGQRHWAADFSIPVRQLGSSNPNPGRDTRANRLCCRTDASRMGRRSPGSLA